jgi:hypothetical protein
MATTLSALRSQARQRADQENSEFIGDDELDIYLNDSYKELYDLLVSKFEDYFVTGPTSFSISTGSSSYSLPSDFYKLLGVDRSTGGSDYYTIRPFSFEDRNNRRNADRYRGIYPNVKYRIVGNSLLFTPDDQAAGDYRLWYIPSVTLLTSDTQEIVPQADRWVEYIVIDSAIKMMLKEESDASGLMQQKMFVLKRIEEMAANRDAGETQRVTDVSRSGYDDPLYYRW